MISQNKFIFKSEMTEPVPQKNNIEQLYQQLKQLARSLMKKERDGHTISPTDLVHSAYEKLAHSNNYFNDETHYYMTMAQQMRRLLIDYARYKNRPSNKGKREHIKFTDTLGIVGTQPNFILINEAIESLHNVDKRSAQIIEWVYFTPLEQQEVADLWKLSISTVERDLKFGRAYISDYINKSQI